VLLASDVGFDFVLGALAAGLVVGLVLDMTHGEVVRMRLEGIGFGLLIPIYFAVTERTAAEAAEAATED
jgi:Kef-type K+ transport system membrane component KefB